MGGGKSSWWRDDCDTHLLSLLRPGFFGPTANHCHLGLKSVSLGSAFYFQSSTIAYLGLGYLKSPLSQTECDFLLPKLTLSTAVIMVLSE